MAAIHTRSLPHRRWFGRRQGKLLCLTALLFLIGGCAVNLVRYRVAEEDLPPRHLVDSIPFFPQDAYQCGPAALAMTLAWSGLDTTPEQLTPAVYTPSRKGSLQPAMVAAARRHGRVAYVISAPEMLMQEIAGGHPVIVLQNLGLSWIPVWHYAVVIGYDLEKDVILLHSGRKACKRMPLKLFHRTWSRSDFWGLLTLPPQQIPATATASSFIEAVSGLEKAKAWQAAIQGYRTALERWPGSLAAGIGLGNGFYALGDLASAEQALRDTVRRSPEAGAAYNNLAQVLWEQGKGREALEAARKAVSLGGAMAPLYQQTLDEIQADLADP